MAQGPVTVYLDSSDFSCLSYPNASADMEMTRDRLVDLATIPPVRFCVLWRPP
jgi:hypothetical protein